jgi:hypothetical protein
MFCRARSVLPHQLRGCVLRALVSFRIVGDVFAGAWTVVHRPCVGVFSSTRWFASTTTSSPTDAPPTKLPLPESAFEVDEFLFVNKLPIVAALLARQTPSGAYLNRFLFALCMRRSGKTMVLRLLQHAAEGDRRMLRWLVHPSNPAYPVLRRFLEKPGVNGFTLFETTFPVIYLDFSTARYSDGRDGAAALVGLILEEGKRLGVIPRAGGGGHPRPSEPRRNRGRRLVNIVAPTPAPAAMNPVAAVADPQAAIKDLVRLLREKFVTEEERLVDGKVTLVRVPKRIVLLIDEYDKPILEALAIERSDEVVKGRISVLSEFYATVKSMAKDFQLVFVTGVTKTSGVSLFSGANNFTSLIETHPEFANSLFCLTEEEIRATYGRYIAESYRDQEWLEPCVKSVTDAGGDVAAVDVAVVNAVMDRLRVLFDGYRLHPKGGWVFNTISVVASLQLKDFVMRWTESGPPAQEDVLTTMALDLSAKEVDALVGDGLAMKWSELKQPMVVARRADQALQLAFQAGLATIKKATLSKTDLGVTDFDVVVGSPNVEVKEFLSKRKFVLLVGKDAGPFEASLRKFAEGLLNGRHADAASGLVEALAISKKHSLLEKEASVGSVVGNLESALVRRRTAFYLGSQVAATRSPTVRHPRGRGHEADAVLVSLRQADDAPVMVVMELKRMSEDASLRKDASSRLEALWREVNAAVVQVLEKRYFKNAEDAVSRLPDSVRKRLRAPVPAANQVGIALVAVVPSNSTAHDGTVTTTLVADEIVDAQDVCGDTTETFSVTVPIPSVPRSMDAAVPVGSVTPREKVAVTIDVTGSGVVVAADRSVALLWKSFRPMSP